MSRCLLALALAAGLAAGVPSARADIGGEPGRAHVVAGVTIVTEPGAEPLPGSIVIRDGLIEMLGAGVDAPADAIVHELPGRTVYAGLVEPYLRLPAEDDESSPARRGAIHENDRVRSDVRAIDLLPVTEELRREMREAGYTVALVAPGRGVFRGAAAVVTLAGSGPGHEVLVPDFAQVVAFEHGHWEDERSYPGSLMGAIALTRQSLLDGRWHRDAWEAWRKSDGTIERPAENVSLRALEPALDRAMPVVFESEDLRMLPRVLKVAREFRLRPVIVSGGSDEYRRIERVRRWLKEADAGLVIPVAFPRAPRWSGPEEEAVVELDDLVHWERAPTNPRELERAGVRFAVTTQGLDKRTQVLARLRAAVRLGLSEETALAAVTTEPARLLGIDERVGTLASGKAANLLVASGPLFAAGTTVEEVWIDGVRYGEDRKRATEADVKGTWDVTVGEGAEARTVRIRLLRGKDALEGEVVAPGAEEAEGDTGEEKKAPPLGDVRLERGVLRFDLEDARIALELEGLVLRGRAEAGGRSWPVLGRRVATEPEEPPGLWEILSEGAPPWPPVADPGAAPGAVLVRGATVWTCGPAGRLERADVLAVDGRIAAVGADLSVPADALVIDGTGKHVTPGLIDCHSHSSIAGDVNECTNSCTAEVRIEDVVDPRSPATYRELAGGLTVSNLVHGSCNVIGGQNAVVKLRWGEPADDLVFAEAPPGIKFALGENVKQSNWDRSDGRYPQTRMGVEQLLRERFDAAAEYRRAWNEWRDGRRRAPPRPDLQLDALVEALDGERLVHCHAYRADEIILLMRVAEDYGFRVRTFQHVLEGYKCADEMAAHGAAGSAFSDWWSYKYEVIDAIPYNGEIMWRRGVSVSFNSDSSELSRRLNLEAAKAVKYGGVPEEEALDFVVRNPAEQLGIDEWVGSLEPGKHADFVIWSGHPLSDLSVCEQTWIEGVRRFSRAEDAAAREDAEALRAKLLAKASALNRMHDLDSSVSDKGAWPGGFALGQRWGESVEEAGLEVEQGVGIVVPRGR